MREHVIMRMAPVEKAAAHARSVPGVHSFLLDDGRGRARQPK